MNQPSAFLSTKEVGGLSDALETVLVTKCVDSHLFHLDWTLQLRNCPSIFPSSVNLLPHAHALNVRKRTNEDVLCFAGAAFFEPPASGIVKLELRLEVYGKPVTETSVISLSVSHPSFPVDESGTAPGSCFDSRRQVPLRDRGRTRADPGHRADTLSRRQVLLPDSNTSFPSSGVVAGPGHFPVSVSASPEKSEGDGVDQVVAQPQPLAPDEKPLFCFVCSPLEEDEQSCDEAEGGEEEASFDSQCWSDVLSSSKKLLKEPNLRVKPGAGAVCLFGLPPPLPTFEPVESSPTGNGFTLGRRFPVGHKQYWRGAYFKPFHVRFVFEVTPELLQYLKSLTKGEGRGQLTDVRRSFRQLLVDVLAYRGTYPPLDDQLWAIGTDTCTDSDRSVSLQESCSPHGGQEVTLIFGMHLRHFTGTSASGPTVEDLEFWVDREYMEEVLFEWPVYDMQETRQLREVVRRCRSVETRRATKPVKITLEVTLAADRAAKVGWALPADQQSRMRYLAPLWNHARWLARIFLGGRKMEFPWLHGGDLCLA